MKYLRMIQSFTAGGILMSIVSGYTNNGQITWAIIGLFTSVIFSLGWRD